MAACPPPSVDCSTTTKKAAPSSAVQLHISCKGLKKIDLFSKSDPLVAVYSPAWGPEIARTELIKNELNPRFTKAIQIEYKFEETQRLKFSVYDLEDENADTLYYDDLIGYMECTLGEIVRAGTFTKEFKGKDGDSSKDHGTITINAEELSNDQQLLEMKFSARGLDKKDFLGKSDPFLEFERQNPDGSYTAVHKTMVIKNTLNPSWPRFDITTHVLCNSNPDRKIRVRCYDWDADSSNDLIGEFYTTLADLSAVASGNQKITPVHSFVDYSMNGCQWEVINPAKQAKKKSYKNSGTVHLDSIKITPVYSFLDYIMGGCQINFTVAVDFSSSNEKSAHPSTKSLHSIDPASDNHYIQVLQAVGSGCQDYDTDKLFPAFGFGATPRVAEEPYFSKLFFPLNGNPDNPNCVGIDGVIEAYKYFLESAEICDRNFASPIINYVVQLAKVAAARPDAQQYFVLLILTDGQLSDVKEMKRALIEASHQPMSVIIVGIGNADMEEMRALDCDEGLLSDGSAVSFRDIVQFVPYATGRFYFMSPEDFASAVLAELPRQLTEYMIKKRIKPLGK